MCGEACNLALEPEKARPDTGTGADSEVVRMGELQFWAFTLWQGPQSRSLCRLYYAHQLQPAAVGQWFIHPVHNR